GLHIRRKRTIQQRGWNPHLRKLRHLVLHQCNQRRNHYHSFFRHDRCRQLITKRFSASRRHHHASVSPSEKTLNNVFLQRPERVVAPILPQRRPQLFSATHAQSIDAT